MATIRSHVEHNSGIPLGGIGAGTVEVRPDGYFHEWLIFNLGAWAPSQPACCTSEPPSMPPGALSFFVWARPRGGAPVMRRLGLRTDQNNMYSFAWLKNVREIEYDGRFPVARLAYHDDDLPVTVTATLFSPFVPHNARLSGTPGCHMVFDIRNRLDKPVDVTLLATLKNPLAWGAPDRNLENRVTRQGDSTFLTMRTRAALHCKATLGSLGLSVTGGTPSWVAGEYEAFFGGYLIWASAFGMCHESLFHDFRLAGRLPSLPGATAPSRLVRMTDKEIEGLPSTQADKLVRTLRQYPFAESLWRRVERVDPALLKSRKGRDQFLREVRVRLETHPMAGPTRTRQAWGDAALASSIALAPQETRDVRFTLGWHFPWHYSAKGPVLGHMYENWFQDAEDVNRFLVANYAAQRPAVEGFANTLYDTSLEPEMADAWSSQLTTLVKTTWWLKNGDFGVWEGLGCCGFHTTDITYQGSFNILALFPELQKQQMEMGARFQRPDGRVHHFFCPDLSAVDQGFDRVDMNQQFVLLVCRDYLWTGDREYLKRLWPNILKAMKNTAELDRDGDGLPDHDTKRNTYDAWNFFGTPSYIASLWLSALLAAARMADDLGHAREAAVWRQRLKKAARSFDRKLWNGEFYSLWVDGKVRDECCMTDQIDGEWFTQLIGLGHVLPEDRIRAALRAIMKYNFTPDNGLQNANYPPQVAKRLSTYQNLQQTAPWTGIEYAIASMMMDFGMFAEARKVVMSIHDRYMRAGRFWNHVECGDHYYRAMSSWAVLLGATGFKVDVPRGVVTFAPATRQPSLRAPWVSSSGWGTFTQSDRRFELICRSGQLGFRQLRLKDVGPVVSATLNGRKLAVKTGRDAAFLTVGFANAMAVHAGDVLVAE